MINLAEFLIPSNTNDSGFNWEEKSPERSLTLIMGKAFLQHPKALTSVTPCCSVAKTCLTPRHHGLQPTMLLCPWDIPSKNTGVGQLPLTYLQKEIVNNVKGKTSLECTSSKSNKNGNE